MRGHEARSACGRALRYCLSGDPPEMTEKELGKAAVGSKGSPRSESPAAQTAVDPWEAAYLRFETPEQEIQKFIGRLETLGVAEWSRQARIVELFCGRGGGLQ